MTIHYHWTDPAYWARIARWIETDYNPRPSDKYWQWPVRGN